MAPMDNALRMGDKKTVAIKTDKFPDMIFMYSESDNQDINASNIVALWEQIYPGEKVRLPRPEELLNEHLCKVEMRTLQIEQDGSITTYIVFEAFGEVFIVDPKNPSPNLLT